MFNTYHANIVENALMMNNSLSEVQRIEFNRNNVNVQQIFKLTSIILDQNEASKQVKNLDTLNKAKSHLSWLYFSQPVNGV